MPKVGLGNAFEACSDLDTAAALKVSGSMYRQQIAVHDQSHGYADTTPTAPEPINLGLGPGN